MSDDPDPDEPDEEPSDEEPEEPEEPEPVEPDPDEDPSPDDDLSSFPPSDEDEREDRVPDDDPRSFFAHPDPLKWIVGGANSLRIVPSSPHDGQNSGPGSLRPWRMSVR